ncbi:hypothetical protein N7448_001550 [Penicillium atrosanguineum]|uniref:Uncharacterized protein n=1 Tax=Penicillium atrosanguineum TaxID=1132637 RepID=A0A9W9HKF8_9EURO|nr:uncharacterized protein N7443_004948 [Penicillium atrosanguineum]KAJ5133422.1 hypothetical protein N7526_004787 [Penicillium atrosanguineum]KAJ5149972.1 hypothetical protein N7448_001550 [Penicillium atrosanguineum]KAJ5305288.1 hypothetical protein N7443_004948 [Penicillium atrosanguineum]KAJ5324750.1 hypothetical protein N7476_003350 [Penicillium atrosanguineum]
MEKARLDRDPFLMKKTLEFLYTDVYNVTFQISGNDSEQPCTKRRKVLNGMGSSNASEWAAHKALFHTRMYAEGDYFMIDTLKRLARKSFFPLICHRLDSKDAQSLVEIYSKRANYQELKKH